MAIPKKIHYCWFGGNELPKLAEKCIKSWKKYCKGYEIIRWDESNFDINSCPLYVRQAYEAKKWAFVTDYARLKILYENGGIYFDTDVEVIRNFDKLLDNQCFMGIEYSGIKDYRVNTGVGIGAEKGFQLIHDIMSDYDDKIFVNDDGTFNIQTCTMLNTTVLANHGYVYENIMQNVEGATIYPYEYFSPKDMVSGKMYKTKNTYSIHHYGLSWTTEENRERQRLYLKRAKRSEFIYNIKVFPNKLLRKIIGEEKYNKLKNKVK